MSALRYVRRPIQVEAVQLYPATISAIKEWAGDAVRIVQPGNVGFSTCLLMVNGEIEAHDGDWIIKRGLDREAHLREFYVMSAGTFHETYERLK